MRLADTGFSHIWFSDLKFSYLKRIERYNREHSNSDIKLNFRQLITIGGEAMVLSLNSSDLNLNTNGKTCAVKFSPAMLNKETIRKLKGKLKEIHGIKQPQSLTNVQVKKSTTEHNNVNSNEKSSSKNIKNKAKTLADDILLEQQVSSKMDKLPDISMRNTPILQSTKSDSVKSTESSKKAFKNTDTKAISHEGRIYKHENIVNVLTQTMDIVNGVPMRIIGM